MYLSPEDFKVKCRFGDRLSHGSFGIVYDAGDYVVKIQNTSESPVEDDNYGFTDGKLSLDS